MKVWKLLLAGVLAASAAQAAPRVEEISGSVKVKRGATETVLRKGDTLQAGDEVRTDETASADIRFDQKTLVRVGAKSAYTVGEKGRGWSPVSSFLASGAVRVLVPGKNAGKQAIKFRMGTPAGTIGVRGTEFTAVHRGEKTSVNSLHGEVLVGPKGLDFGDLSKFALVLAGFRAEIEEGDSDAPKIERFQILDFVKDLDGKSASNPFAALAWRRTGGQKQYGKHAPVVPPKGLTAQFKAPSDANKNGTGKGDLSEQVQSLTADLIAAVKRQDIEEIEEIANKLGGVKAFRTVTGDTLLHVAAAYGALQVVQYCIDEGISVDAKNAKGQSPLILVVEQTGNVDMVMLLLQNDAKIHLEDNNEKNALELALELKRDDIAKLLEAEAGNK